MAPKKTKSSSEATSSLIAIVEIGGQQHIVRAGDTISVMHQDGEEGKTLEFSPYLITDSDGASTRVGMPTVEGSKVVCKILSHEKGEKVHVFRMKSKKHSARTRNFRASLTSLEVVSVA